MELASIQAIFAFVFGLIARYCLPRGWMFVRMGYFAIRTYGEAGNVREDIERQRGMSSGTNFFVAGLGWLIAGIIAAGVTLILIVMAGLSITGS
jgi:hypothetical protein